MGQAKRRRDRYFTAHPTCIFCGGGTPATTIDHVPSRQLFAGRHAPEDFKFPACDSCNGTTRGDEQVVAMIARMYPDPKTEADRAEMLRIMAAVSNNRPNVLHEMAPSARKVRTFLRKRGIVLSAGESTEDVRIVSLGGPLVTACIRSFSRKLFTALHYKETGKIVPPEGGVAWRWYSNLQHIEGELPEEQVMLLGGRPAIRRALRNLSDQFDYAFGATPDGGLGAYFTTFRFAFAIFGFVVLDLAKSPVPVAPERLLYPLAPDEPG